MNEMEKKKFKCKVRSSSMKLFFSCSVCVKNAVMCLKCQYDIQSHTGLVELLLLAVSLAELHQWNQMLGHFIQLL